VPTSPLNSRGIAVQNLQNGQQALVTRLFRGDPPGRHERHHDMKSDVIFTSEATRIGQRPCRDKLLRAGAIFDFPDQQGLEFLKRSLLHQIDQRLERAEGQPVARIIRQRGRDPKLRGQACAQRGSEHSLTDFQ
jgi:hypothetical protein